MARPPKLNGNQFRADQQTKLDSSALVTRFFTLAMNRLDAALQQSFEDAVPVGAEITRTYSTLEAGAAFRLPDATADEIATPALASLVLQQVKDALTTEFNRRGFTVSFEDTETPTMHFVTIA